MEIFTVQYLYLTGKPEHLFREDKLEIKALDIYEAYDQAKDRLTEMYQKHYIIDVKPLHK